MKLRCGCHAATPLLRSKRLPIEATRQHEAGGRCSYTGNQRDQRGLTFSRRARQQDLSPARILEVTGESLAPDGRDAGT